MKKLKWKGNHIYKNGDIVISPSDISEELDDKLADRMLQDFGPLFEVVSESKENANIMHKCDICGKDFDTPQGLSSHKRAHEKDDSEDNKEDSKPKFRL